MTMKDIALRLFHINHVNRIRQDLADEIYRYCYKQRLLAKRDHNLDDYMAWNEETLAWAKAYHACDKKATAAFHMFQNIQVMRGIDGYHASVLKG